MLKKIVLLTTALLGMQVAQAKNTIEPCKSDQVEIHMLASDSSGMVHYSFLYGVMNTSKIRCAIPEKVDVWAVRKDGKAGKISDEIAIGPTGFSLDRQTLMKEMRIADLKALDSKQPYKPIVLEPTAGRNFIYAHQLAWFSFSGGGNDLPAYKMVIKLPGLKKVFSSPGSSFDSWLRLDSQRIQKGNLAKWRPLSGNDCFYGRAPWDQKNLNALKIYFRRFADCG